jgi:glycosyltransferase involved in cell wall biosynthesis
LHLVQQAIEEIMRGNCSPCVSVLIPCFNAEAFIAEALDSVLRQTWTQIEIIVVDDGSTDASPSILARYENRGVRVVRQENQGQCAAANRAFELSTGELIKFFDADDLLAPDMVEKQVISLRGRSDAIAMGEWARFYGSNPAEATFETRAMYRDADPADWLAAEWYGARCMMQCALWLIPRPILEHSGLWDERLTLINDFEFFARVLLNASQIVYTPGARMFYRSGIPSSLSARRSRKAVESAFLSLTLGTGHLLKVEDSARTRRACANLLQDFEYTYFPDHADLRAAARKRVSELGGADLSPDGPPRFHRLRQLVGWRLARRAQHFAEKLGLNQASLSRPGRACR